jgi:DNA-binding transcriptional LysR family regulator
LQPRIAQQVFVEMLDRLTRPTSLSQEPHCIHRCSPELDHGARYSAPIHFKNEYVLYYPSHNVINRMRPDIDTDLLRAFVAVADRGGFTPAARALSRTQSAVSMQIKRLEASTQTDLFEREGRTVRLTRHGEAFLGYARRMLALQEEAFRALAAERVEGPVRIGAMDDYGTRVLPGLIAAFCRDYPSVSVGRRFDLVLAMHPAGTRRGEVVRREATIWAGSRTHATHERDPVPLALAPQPCLFRDWSLAALDKAERRWRLAYMSPSLGAVEAAAASGLAVTVLKASMLPPTLRALTPRDGLPKLPAAEIALHRAAKSGSRAAGKLGDYLIETLRDGSVRA